MINDVTLHAFDEIVNPILLTETDGRVIYKNPEAILKLRKPIRGGNIRKYLTADSAPLLTPPATAAQFPAIVELVSEGESYHAFADIVYYERRPTVMFVLSHLFSYDLALPFFLLPKETLREKTSAETLSRKLTEIYTSDALITLMRSRKYHRRMTEIYYKIVDRLLTELAYGNERIYYPLAYTLDILAYTCERILTPLGLDVLFDCQYEGADMILVDFKTLTLLSANFILYAAEMSDSHIIRLSISRNEDDSVRLFLCETHEKPLSVIPFGGANSFSELLPGRVIDLYFFDKVLAADQYRFNFSLSKKNENNLSMQLTAPIFRPTVVRDKSLISRKEAYCLIDRLLTLFSTED